MSHGADIINHLLTINNRETIEMTQEKLKKYFLKAIII